jgi:hypothetical protein
MQPGDEATVSFTLDDLRLKPGPYLVGLWMGRGNVEDIDGIVYAATLEVEPDPQQLQHSEQFPAPYLCAFEHSVVIASTAGTAMLVEMGQSDHRAAASASR